MSKAEQAKAAKAFSTECMGVTSIVFAATRGQAKYTTWSEANDAGYEVKFGDIRVVRANEYDFATDHNRRIPTARMGYAPEYLEPANAQQHKG